MTPKKYELPFFLAIFVGMLALSFWLFKPFIPVLALSAMFAVIFHPVYDKLNTLFRGKLGGFPAFLTVIFAIIIIFVPLSIVGAQVIAEARSLYLLITQNGGLYLGNLTENIVEPIRRYNPEFSPDFAAYARQALSWIVTNLGQIFSGTIQVIIGFFLGCIALYYFLKDGKRFASSLMTLSPLGDQYDLMIQERLKLAINSIVKGSLLIALIQGVLSGIGFVLFGVPNPALWGSLAAITALIPGIGTSIIMVPAIIYLFVTGDTWQAVGLLIWGSTAVGMIDNLLGPALIGAGVRIHPLLVLFSVLGGLTMFGPTGFLLGPLILSLLYALVDIYQLLILKVKPMAR